MRNGGSTRCGRRPAAIDGWLAPYRRRWSERLDALERHLESINDDG